MAMMTTITEKVEKAIESLLLEDLNISFEGSPPELFVTITSRSFSGMDEAKRQEKVWDALRSGLDDSERSAVEFVFTVAPDDPDQDEA